MITPIEIRQHSFRKRTLGGYDVEDVQQFVATLSVDWEKMIEENRKLRSEFDKVQAGYNSLKEVENMLQKTLHQAEQSTKDTLDNARKRGSLIVSEAEAKAREIIRQGVDERNNIDREITELCERRDEILMQLNLFLKAQTDRLVGFSRKSKVGIMTIESVMEKMPQTENLFDNSLPANHTKDEEKHNVEDIVEQL